MKLSCRHHWGAVLWVLSIQYYIVQLVAAAAWSSTRGYSWAGNTISDLGNTHCGLYGDRLVCSPLHFYMNLSFIILGTTMTVGAAMLMSRNSRMSVKTGLSLLIAAGVGTVIVGLFPENTISALHILGAALPFTLGNLGMILIGLYLEALPRVLRIFTIASGAIGLAALVLFMTQSYFGLGIGGMERIVGYPQSIWMIVFGLFMLAGRIPKPLTD